MLINRLWQALRVCSPLQNRSLSSSRLSNARDLRSFRSSRVPKATVRNNNSLYPRVSFGSPTSKTTPTHHIDLPGTSLSMLEDLDAFDLAPGVVTEDAIKTGLQLRARKLGYDLKEQEHGEIADYVVLHEGFMQSRNVKMQVKPWRDGQWCFWVPLALVSNGTVWLCQLEIFRYHQATERPPLFEYDHLRATEGPQMPFTVAYHGTIIFEIPDTVLLSNERAIHRRLRTAPGEERDQLVKQLKHFHELRSFSPGNTSTASSLSPRVDPEALIRLPSWSEAANYDVNGQLDARCKPAFGWTVRNNAQLYRLEPSAETRVKREDRNIKRASHILKWRELEDARMDLAKETNRAKLWKDPAQQDVQGNTMPEAYIIPDTPSIHPPQAHLLPYTNTTDESNTCGVQTALAVLPTHPHQLDPPTPILPMAASESATPTSHSPRDPSVIYVWPARHEVETPHVIMMQPPPSHATQLTPVSYVWPALPLEAETPAARETEPLPATSTRVSSGEPSQEGARHYRANALPHEHFSSGTFFSGSFTPRRDELERGTAAKRRILAAIRSMLQLGLGFVAGFVAIYCGSIFYSSW